MTTLNPYLSFRDNAKEAMTFYQSVFGGEFTSLFRFRDLPIEGVTLTEEQSNQIMHIGMRIDGGTRLMGNDSLPMFGKNLQPGNTVYLSVSPDSKEEADRVFSALSAGGEVETPMADQSWGDYYGALTDKFGVQWMVNFEQTGQG